MSTKGKLQEIPLSAQIDGLDREQTLILFDFNGTLGLKGKRVKGSTRAASLRPGLQTLSLLTEAGHAIGIWRYATNIYAY
jgi:hypothetical protein